MNQSYSEILDAHRAQRREALLLAAAEVLNERGLRKATMEQVAQHAGVSKVVLYRYFKSKDRLVDAVLCDMIDAMLAADEEPANWWTERVRRTLTVSRRNPAALQLLVRQASHDPVHGKRFEELSDAFSRRVLEREAEILGPPEGTPADSMMMANAVTAFLFDAYVRWIDDGRPDEDDRFLKWITQSVRAMVYYWRGIDP